MAAMQKLNRDWTISARNVNFRMGIDYKCTCRFCIKYFYIKVVNMENKVLKIGLITLIHKEPNSVDIISSIIGN
jgi:hypothetical protein